MGRKKVLCFGDSNTYGCAPLGCQNLWPDRFDKEIRWPSRMGQILGPEYQVAEQGKNGRTLGCCAAGEEDECGMMELPFVLRQQAPLDLLILMLGTNDLQARFGATAESMLEDMEKMLNLVQYSRAGRDKNSPLVLLAAPIEAKAGTRASAFSGFFQPDAAAILKVYRTGLQELAQSRGLYFHDASRVTPPSVEDGIHLDPSGHQKLAEVFACRVLEILT